jgi:hypothetical protein
MEEIEMDLKNVERWRELDSFRSGQGQVMGWYGNGNEHSGSTNFTRKSQERWRLVVPLFNYMKNLYVNKQAYIRTKCHLQLFSFSLKPFLPSDRHLTITLKLPNKT